MRADKRSIPAGRVENRWKAVENTVEKVEKQPDNTGKQLWKNERKDMEQSLEEMSRFFAARTEGYDRHMLDEVEGCAEGYRLMASLLPADLSSLLDLGCGTGLELDEIFRRFPELRVTGIDLTQAMLDRLREKHPCRAMTLLCGNYLEADLGRACFDAAVSFQTLHHLTPGEKAALYRRLYQALRPGGRYLECDYMVETQEDEDHWFAECVRLRRRQGVPDGMAVHFDTPCAIGNQIRLLQQAGFRVRQHWRRGNTTLLVADK